MEEGNESHIFRAFVSISSITGLYKTCSIELKELRLKQLLYNNLSQNFSIVFNLYRTRLAFINNYSSRNENGTFIQNCSSRGHPRFTIKCAPRTLTHLTRSSLQKAHGQTTIPPQLTQKDYKSRSVIQNNITSH